MRKMEEQQQQQQQQQISNGGTSATSHSGSNGVGPGLLIVAAIILLVFVVSAVIHVLLRIFSRKSSSAVSTGADSPIFVPAMVPPSPSRTRGGGIEDGEKDLIESLPLFTLASALSVAPKSAADCAVCLSRFDLHDQLRLLPACRHAFHSTCIDTWLRSNLSCPLCRASIIQDAPPPPAPPITPSTFAAPQSRDSSGSFRVEIGSVSRRRGTPDESAAGLPHSRSYSLGSSFHYVVEEELDAVINSIARNIQDQRRKDQIKDLRRLAEAAGGGSRGWLMDYMERLASSASSSFSSLRFAGCGSRRTDGDAVAASSSAFWWDQDDRQQQHQQEDDDVGSVNSFFRWLVGA